MRGSYFLLLLGILSVAAPGVAYALLSDVKLTYCSGTVTDKRGIDSCDPKKTIKSTEIAVRGTETNVVVMATFKPAAEPWRILFKITDANDGIVEDIQIPIPAKASQATMHTTVVRPGVYNLVHQHTSLET